MSKLEKAILQAVQELGANARGIVVRRRVNEILGRPQWWNGISIGKFYVTCEQMEERGLLNAYETEGGAERGFRMHRVFYATRQAVALMETK